MEQRTELHWWPTDVQQIWSIQINGTGTDLSVEVYAISKGLLAQLKQDKCKGFIFYPDKLYVCIL